MKKNIPYGHQWLTDGDIRAVNRVLGSDWLTQGPAVKDFEDDLCGRTGARFAVAVSNGTAALHLSCLAAGVGKGDEVVTSPMTFLASANCALYCGGKAVFSDIDPVNANVTAALLGQQTTARTKALIPVHFAGLSCDMAEISVLARRKRLTVIEDACHALGASYGGAAVGSCRYSDMAVFSFHPVKSITTGEGGAVTTNDPALYRKLLVLRNHGIVKEGLTRSPGDWYYQMRMLGFNYRITDIQAALGSSQLKRLDHFIRRRLDIVRTYQRVFAGNAFFDIPVWSAESAWHLYAVRLKQPLVRRKRELFSCLRSAGIGVQVHYVPVHTQPFYREHVCGTISRPAAEEFYRRELSLPLYPAMNDKDVLRVARTVLRTCAKVAR